MIAPSGVDKANSAISRMFLCLLPPDAMSIKDRATAAGSLWPIIAMVTMPILPSPATVALYFTLTTLTTTGFGDITLQGQSGRMLAVIIMVFGITLFVRLARDIIRPAKVSYECEHCGLFKHDVDASHCKHCGNIIHIETEGA